MQPSLPFFMPSYQKDTEITIYGSSRKGRFLSSILHEQMDYEYFPVSMSSLMADINIKEIEGSEIRLGPLTIGCQEQVFHPGGSVRYKVSLNGRQVIYATDVELDEMFNIDDNDEENRKLIQEFMEFISGADLLIADAQYTEDEYPQKTGWGHTSVPILLDAAYKSNVKQLAVFHHDPQHSDKFLDELYMKNRSKYLEGDKKMDLFWAREGMSLAI